MIHIKTMEDIEVITEGADILGIVHGEVARWIKPGVTTKHLDAIAEECIKDYGGVPSFKDYNGFPNSLCISINEVVVHGIPSQYELKETDIVSIDCGVFYRGFHSDSAYTYPLEGTMPATLDLLERTYESLYLGTEQAKQGNKVGDIGFAIQNYVESFGYGVVRELVGHGVGRGLHEEPEIPNYGKKGKGAKIVQGMVFAIEPMINLGGKDVVQEKDGWTIRTKDRKPSAHFEHTVAVLDGETRIVTTYKYIEENYTYKWRSKNP